jgi:membrane-bound lytic murein transglycosylase A
MLARQHFNDLQGWASDDHGQALDAFRRSASQILAPTSGVPRPARFGGTRDAWLDTCRMSLERQDARRFFEDHFRPYRVQDEACPEGLFTGYFEPEVVGRLRPSEAFQVPVYRRPADLVTVSSEGGLRTGLSFGRLVDGEVQPYFTRRDIEQGALSGQGLEIVWLSDWADAYFMQVQGSGRVRLEDGRIIRLTYGGKTGLPYTSIGAVLVARGIIPHEQISMQSIRRWMSAHPGEARELMWRNESFVFFREVELPRQDLGAFGAQHVQLTPRRSLAVDRSLWMFGTPVWLDTVVPTDEKGGMKIFHQLMIAQDTGTAIRGLARGDLYWGSGDDAAMISGHMKSPGGMSVLLPTAVAEELGLPQ